jgi:hypothetical protein
MRFFNISALALISILSASCGSSDGGNSGGGNNGNTNPGGAPLSEMDCEAAWTSYVKSHPRGLMLRYENRSMGHISQNTIEVTESSDSAVTESHRTGGNTTSTTMTKDEWMQSCTPPSEAPSNNTGNGTIEAQRKEIKSTRAGTFNSNYVKMKFTQTLGDSAAVTVTETWTNDETYSSFLVFSKSIMTSETHTMESITELIGIVRP